MRIIAAIGIIIALIIIINYANLSMAILSQRSKKEFSMRKIGAPRKSLITIIFIESTICVLISFSMAFLWLFIFDRTVQIETVFDRAVSVSDLFENQHGSIIGCRGAQQLASSISLVRVKHSRSEKFKDFQIEDLKTH